MAENQNVHDEGGIPGESNMDSPSFPTSFYENLLASTRNVPNEESDAFSSWSPYNAASNPDFSLGYNTWTSAYGGNPNFSNSYSDAFGSTGQAPASQPYNQGLENYFSNLHSPADRSNSNGGGDNVQQGAFAPGPSTYSSTMPGLNLNLDFMQAASNGRDLYAEAYEQWGRTTSPTMTSAESNPSGASSPSLFSGPTWDPFGTGDVFQNVESMKSSSNQQENHHSHSPVESVGATYSPVQVPPAQPRSTKPSYSDVAKNKLVQNSTNAASRREESNYRDMNKQETFPSSQATTVPNVKPLKSKKAKGRHGGAKNRPVSTEPTTIQPDSRYGLDTFDVPGDLLSGARDKTQGKLSSNSNESSRKGSCSSVGSGASGLEEIEKHSDTPPVNVYDIQGPGPGSGMKYNAKTGEILKDTNSSSAGAGSKGASKMSNNDVTRPNAKKSGKNTAKSSATADKTFFDPKRIFATSEKVKQSPNNKNYIPNNQQNLRKDEEDNVFSNGKSKSNWKSGSTRYINNDLRDSSKKQTNTETRNTNTGNMFAEKSKESERPQSSNAKKRTDTGANTKKTATSSSQTTEEPAKSDKKRVKKEKVPPPTHRLGEMLLHLWELVLWASKKLLHILWNLVKLVLSVSLLFLMVAWHYLATWSKKAWGYLTTKIPFLQNYASGNADGQSWYDGNNSQAKPRASFGLKENITLPTTGEEAMKRLLSCKGKDPYSILGVKADANDDEIRKYYRRQAVLVHPDKNQQPGAEEAFKILGHAFELIGEPDKRRSYDFQRTEAQETESAMHEFADLLTKLHDKMQEASNMMRCEHCGGKHKRVLTEWPAYSARFCNRCNVRHPSKEGDVWAESSVLGFLWHYYACMEGKVYDITEWASCQRESFKCMQANAHQVIYRISTGAGRNRNNSTRANEADLEDFLSNLFHHPGAAPGAEAAGNYSHFQGGAGANGPSTAQRGHGWSSGGHAPPGAKKGSRKRKGRKH